MESAVSVESQDEVMGSLEEVIRESAQFASSSIEEDWQPSDFLPDFATDSYPQQIQALRDSASRLPEDVLVVLVGSTVTEEALPSYAVELSRHARERADNAEGALAIWHRAWTAEENRHGDVLNGYLRMSGRVDMRAVEITIQHLLARGFDPKTGSEPYKGLLYAAFQERATTVVHANTGRIAAAAGDEKLAIICKKIAADEARHANFYTRILKCIFDRDPAAAIVAMKQILRSVVTLPSKRMYDGRDAQLFDHTSFVAQRCGILTVGDYSSIIAHFISVWSVASRSVSGEAARAQEYICKQPDRYRDLMEPVSALVAAAPKVAFRSIFNREV